MSSLLSPSTLTGLLYGALGGVAIGAAATVNVVNLGNPIAVSGSLEALATRPASTLRAQNTHGPFLLGVLLSGVAARVLGFDVVASPATLAARLRPELTVAAGLLVGYGTRLANGCTSGHGVCGLPRLSPRSLVAVCTFMGSGMVTASLLRGVPSLRAWAFLPTAPAAAGGAWVLLPLLLLSCAALEAGGVFGPSPPPSPATTPSLWARFSGRRCACPACPTRRRWAPFWRRLRQRGGPPPSPASWAGRWW